MTNDLSRKEYPALLDTLHPTQAVTLLNERLKHVAKVNIEIADWLQERRRIEEIYAASLRKLAQKEPPDSSSELGIFTTSWQKVVGSAASLADSHQMLAQKIESDIEKPLRTFTTTNREIQAMPNMQGHLQSLARDYDTAQKKSEKLKGKATNNKVASASAEMENASSQWTTQAPYVFEALQAVDESRCNHLRDALTQFQTHEVDLVEKSRKTAESTLNSVLNIETADEIKTFVARNSDGAGAASDAARRRSDRRQSRSQGSNTLIPTVATPPPDDQTSQRSASVQEEKKSRLGGLKRLGTVMRRKSAAPPPPASRPPPATKSSASNLASNTVSNGDPPPVTREVTSSSLQDWQLPPTGLDMPSTAEEPSRSTEPVEPAATSTLPPEPSPPAAEASQLGTTNMNMSSYQNEIAQLQEPPVLATSSGAVAAPEVTPIAQSETQDPISLNPQSQTTARDSEGFNVPVANDDPISQAERDAASSELPASQFKVDIRNAPIAEDTSDADSAMANMANTLRAQAVPPRRSATNRGRREIRSAVFPSSSGIDASSNESPLPSASPPARSFTPPPAAAPAALSIVPTSSPLTTAPASPPQIPKRSSTNDEHPASDSQSIMSSRSAGANALVPRHPAMHGDGLNSSIIETVSVWLEKGSITRAAVIGEVALACNLPSSTEAPTTGTIRLENFSSLEKVAPNPAFISNAKVGGGVGEYSIDLASLSRNASNALTAFKYQVHISNDRIKTQAPVILVPSWRVEENQTSVILSYSANPESTAPVTLTNVTFILHLGVNDSGTGRAVSCQSKPAGTFSREKNLIFWRFEELTLSPGVPAQKILARFATDGQAKEGKVEAKWEIAGESTFTSGLGSGLEVSHFDMTDSSTDPFADDDVQGTWKTLHSSRKVISGTYAAL